MILEVWLIVVIIAAVLIVIVLPLICCCVCCGWCCCGSRQKAGDVHVHTKQAIGLDHANSHRQPQLQPQAYPAYNYNVYPQPNPGLDFNTSDNSPSFQRGYERQSQYNGDQRYKPLTEFGLNRNQYPDVHRYEYAPRNYLGQSHYDIYQQPTHYQHQRNFPSAAKVGLIGVQQQKY